MDTNFRVSPIYFKSLLNPVKPFKIQINGEKIRFREPDYTINHTEDFYTNIAKFFLDIFCETSSHPYWRNFRPCNRDTVMYNSYIANTIAELKSEMLNPNTTLLIGESKNKCPVGATFARPLYLNNQINDDKTLYIDSIAVAPKYRGNNLGRYMLSAVIEPAKKHFYDVFLVSYKESVPFYFKNCFSRFVSKSADDDLVIRELSKYRIDYPNYADFMHKSISSNEETWVQRVLKNYIPEE